MSPSVGRSRKTRLFELAGALVGVVAMAGLVVRAPGCAQRGQVTMSSEAPIPTAIPVVEGQPVYNVVANPAARARPLELREGVSTTIDFYIGPAAADSSVKPGEAEVPTVIRNAEALELTVAMSCLICAEDRLQSGQIAYRRATHQSDHARFKIIPVRPVTPAQMANQALTFSVSRNGLEYSHIVVPVHVLAKNQEVSPNPVGVVTQAFTDILGGQAADLRLLIGTDTKGGTLAIEIEPIRESLKARLRPFLRQMPRRKFSSGLSKEGLREVAQDIYRALRGVVNQKEEALQQALAQIDAKVPTPTTEVKLTPDEGAAVTSAILLAGQNFYARLFVKGAESELASAMKQVSAETRLQPLRVRLETSDTEAAWQFLHPQDSDDPADFWGFKYALAVRPNSSLSGSHLREALPIGPASRILFARYKGDPKTELIANLGDLALADLRQLFGPDGVRVANSRFGFVAEIRAGAERLSAVFVFAHGTSGITVVETGKGVPLLAQDCLGERLLFGKNDEITPLQLNGLGYGRNPVKLTQSPLVFLNACESGAGVVDSGFPSAALGLGAGAVVAAEAPIWMHFGYYFGRDLTNAFAKGEPLADAMLSVRKRYLKEYNNPLGLSYSYYGGLNLTAAR